MNYTEAINTVAQFVEALQAMQQEAETSKQEATQKGYVISGLRIELEAANIELERVKRMFAVLLQHSHVKICPVCTGYGGST